MHLEILSYIPNKNKRLDDLRDIFFKTTKAELNSEEERQNLFDKYAAPYIENWPDYVFFACDEASGRTMGYLTGCEDSKKAIEVLSTKQKSYTLFSDLYLRFPAHLHVDIHPDFQGKGVGTFLLQEFVIEMKKKGLRGLHILTAPGDSSVQFYLRNKFKFQVVRSFNGREILFMGLNF
jgi:GNAT superfamily N-acetyltransferase